ncbi:MAG: hypothetical protein ACLU7D_08190 [Collinsella sp.]
MLVVTGIGLLVHIFSWDTWRTTRPRPATSPA